MVPMTEHLYCVSPDCRDECGRWLSAILRVDLTMRGIAYQTAYFCDAQSEPLGTGYRPAIVLPDIVMPEYT